MRAGRGDWVTKIGAEGVQAIGVRSRGSGIAIKVADGAGAGCIPATVAVLDQLGLLDDAQRAALAAVGASPRVRNYRGIVTGEVRPLVVLDNAGGRTRQPRPSGRDRRVGVNFRTPRGGLSVQGKRCRAAAPDVAGTGRSERGLATAAAPAVRRDNNE